MYSTEKLKALRKEKKLKISDIADMLSITPAYYCQLENKKRRLFYDMAIKISKVFDMKPDDIFYKKNT